MSSRHEDGESVVVEHIEVDAGEALPPVRVSSPALHSRHVDFPERDGAMMAVKWPTGNSAEAPSTGCTLVWLSPYILTARRLCGRAHSMRSGARGIVRAST